LRLFVLFIERRVPICKKEYYDEESGGGHGASTGKKLGPPLTFDDL
jgi:hypothetical protein